MALVGAAIVGIGVASVGIGAAGVGGAGIVSVHRHKKKKKKNAKLHLQMIDSMEDQWNYINSEDNLDKSLFPIHLNCESLNVSDAISFGVGWHDTAIIEETDIHLLLTGFDKNGTVIHSLSMNNTKNNLLQGISHSGTIKLKKKKRDSGYSDKQIIDIQFSNFCDSVDSIIVGCLIQSKEPFDESYISLYNGNNPHSTNEQPIIRYHLDKSECGVGNGYIMGIIRRHNNSWVFNPIRLSFCSKTEIDFICKAQEFVIPSLDIAKFSSEINIESSDNVKVKTLCLAYDRFGYLRYSREYEFNDFISVEDLITCDTICKVVVVHTSNNLHADLTLTLKNDDKIETFSLNSKSLLQVLVVFYSYEIKRNIPFPPKRIDEDWTVAIYHEKILLCANDKESIEKQITKEYSPFIANTVVITLHRACITLQSTKDLSSKKLKKLNKKSEKLTALVKMYLNGISVSSEPAPKGDLTPEWDSTFFLPIHQKWQTEESIVTFKIKDSATKERIGECGYCLKTLNIPFNGSLELDTKAGEIFFSINVIEHPDIVNIQIDDEETKHEKKIEPIEEDIII